MKKKKKYYPLIFIAIISIFSLLNNYNARYISSEYKDYFNKQLIFFIIGIFIIFFFHKLNLKFFFKISPYLYYICNILLILVLIYGKEINGAKAWLDLKFFSFQPSEAMKLALALYLSKITIEYNKSYKRNEIIFLGKIFLITLIPSILVFIEPDTGAIIFYFITLLCAFFYSSVNKRWRILLVVIIVLLITSSVYLYFFNQDLLINLIGTSFFYRVDRLINLSDNYQINNALTLIGQANFTGGGIGYKPIHLPEAPTDFIYAYNFGNFGLLGATILTLSYFFLIITLLMQIKKTKNNLFKYIFIASMFFAITYNISMNIGLVPIMGIALPFLSYGGSSIIINTIFLALFFEKY